MKIKINKIDQRSSELLGTQNFKIRIEIWQSLGDYSSDFISQLMKEDGDSISS